MGRRRKDKRCSPILLGYVKEAAVAKNGRKHTRGGVDVRRAKARKNGCKVDNLPPPPFKRERKADRYTRALQDTRNKDDGHRSRVVAPLQPAHAAREDEAALHLVADCATPMAAPSPAGGAATAGPPLDTTTRLTGWREDVDCAGCSSLLVTTTAAPDVMWAISDAEIGSSGHTAASAPSQEITFMVPATPDDMEADGDSAEAAGGQQGHPVARQDTVGVAVEGFIEQFAAVPRGAAQVQALNESLAWRDVEDVELAAVSGEVLQYLQQLAACLQTVEDALRRHITYGQGKEVHDGTLQRMLAGLDGAVAELSEKLEGVTAFPSAETVAKSSREAAARILELVWMAKAQGAEEQMGTSMAAAAAWSWGAAGPGLGAQPAPTYAAQRLGAAAAGPAAAGDAPSEVEAPPQLAAVASLWGAAAAAAALVQQVDPDDAQAAVEGSDNLTLGQLEVVEPSVLDATPSRVHGHHKGDFPGPHRQQARATGAAAAAAGAAARSPAISAAPAAAAAAPPARPAPVSSPDLRSGTAAALDGAGEAASRPTVPPEPAAAVLPAPRLAAAAFLGPRGAAAGGAALSAAAAQPAASGPDGEGGAGPGGEGGAEGLPAAAGEPTAIKQLRSLHAAAASLLLPVLLRATNQQKGRNGPVVWRKRGTNYYAVAFCPPNAAGYKVKSGQAKTRVLYVAPGDPQQVQEGAPGQWYTAIGGRSCDWYTSAEGVEVAQGQAGQLTWRPYRDWIKAYSTATLNDPEAEASDLPAKRAGRGHAARRALPEPEPAAAAAAGGQSGAEAVALDPAAFPAGAGPGGAAKAAGRRARPQEQEPAAAPRPPKQRRRAAPEEVEAGEAGAGGSGAAQAQDGEAPLIADGVAAEAEAAAGGMDAAAQDAVDTSPHLFAVIAVLWDKDVDAAAMVGCHLMSLKATLRLDPPYAPVLLRSECGGHVRYGVAFHERPGAARGRSKGDRKPGVRVLHAPPACEAPARTEAAMQRATGVRLPVPSPGDRPGVPRSAAAGPLRRLYELPSPAHLFQLAAAAAGRGADQPAAAAGQGEWLGATRVAAVVGPGQAPEPGEVEEKVVVQKEAQQHLSFTWRRYQDMEQQRGCMPGCDGGAGAVRRARLKRRRG